MKTIREYLKELPSEISRRAINNSNDVMLSTPATSLSSALKRAFIWSKSPEGIDFWNKVTETEQENGN